MPLKESTEFVAGVAALAGKIHERIEDGFQPLSDLPAIVAFALGDPEVQAAFKGISDIPDEAEKAKTSDWLDLVAEGFTQAAQEVRTAGN